MRQGHLHGKFMEDSLTEMTLVAEKNSKKEVNRLISEIENYNSQSTVMNIDARKIPVDKLRELISLSRQLLGNLDYSMMKVIKIQVEGLDELQEAIPKEVATHLDGLGSPGRLEAINRLSETLLLQYIVYLNDIADMVVLKMDQQKEFYEGVLSRADEKPSVQLETKRKFSFKSYQTDLTSMYDHCFNLVLQVTSPYLAINPNISFQRKLVWPVDKKISFIDSLVNEIPIGAFYVNARIHDLDLGEGFGRILWDGKQRMYALHSFILDEFPVEVNGQKVYYSQSAPFFNRVFRNTQVSMFESSFETLREIIEAYIAINQKQIRHTDEDLEHAINVLLQNS